MSARSRKRLQSYRERSRDLREAERRRGNDSRRTSEVAAPIFCLLDAYCFRRPDHFGPCTPDAAEVER